MFNSTMFLCVYDLSYRSKASYWVTEIVFSLYNYISVVYVLFLLNYIIAVPSVTGINKVGNKHD